MNQPQKCKILLLGQSAVGKTSLFRRYTNNPNMKVNPTIGAEYKQKIIQLSNGITMKIQLWDTAGTERYRTISPIYYRNLDGVLLIFDITDAGSFRSLQYWIDELRQKGEQAEIVLVGNKNDQKEKRQVTHEAALQKAKEWNIAYVEANTLSQQSVKEAFEMLISKISQKKKEKANNEDNQMQSKRSEFQELKLKDLPKRMNSEDKDSCC